MRGVRMEGKDRRLAVKSKSDEVGTMGQSSLIDSALSMTDSQPLSIRYNKGTGPLLLPWQ